MARMVSKWLSISAAVVTLTAVSPVSAASVVLKFEDINPAGAVSTAIGDYYNGGISAAGTSGTNYGVSFSSNALALCMNTPGDFCSNTSRGGFGDPSSQKGGLIWLTGAETYLNYAAGFETGFSFFYSAPYFTGAVSVFDGLNGTGNVLGTIALGLTTNGGCDASYSGSANYCPLVPVGVTFSGIAKSISFAGTANYIIYDDVTFGSATPGVPDVPEPASWMMMIVGIGAVGATLRRRRAVVSLALGDCRG
jgi:hypothetical protein